MTEAFKALSYKIFYAEDWLGNTEIAGEACENQGEMVGVERLKHNL